MSATVLKPIPKAKFSFDTLTACEKARDMVRETHPSLMSNITESSTDSKFYLFVQSLCSTIFDINVRSIVEKAVGTFLTMVK